jgi:tetratricopeptide (TPR) repeat protein
VPHIEAVGKTVGELKKYLCGRSRMTERTHDAHPAEQDATEFYRLGSEALRLRNYPAARRYLERALHEERSPEHLSQYALALAHHTGNTRAAIALCQEALKRDPKNQEHFLRLGTVYLIAGRRRDAVKLFHLGLRLGRHAALARMLQVMGHRQKPVLPFLARSNPLNKYLGKIRVSLSKGVKRR